MGKRKRVADVTPAEAPAAKKQTTEPSATTTITAAERRQQRSERKSKKAAKAKDNASKNQVANQLELLAPSTTAAAGDDSFAGGNDFVPLTDATNTAPTSNEVSTSTQTKSKATTKPKRSSPRSERKKAKEAKGQAAVVEEYDPSTLPNSSTATRSSKEKEPKDNSRFIVFVGNLPFSTTTAQIQSHFRKLSPTSIRHNTDKTTGKSRGFAFLEFDDYSAMKTCLKVYHHSIFDPERTAKLPDSAFDENGLEIQQPGQEKKRQGRKINVELTAGGGGRGSGRQEKIRKKNEKLFDERERRKKTEMREEQTRKKRKAEEGDKEVPTEIGADAVHPSRLKRVKH